MKTATASGQTESLARFLAEAPRLVAEGQGQALAELARALPESAFADNPWVGYWLAYTFLGSDTRRVLALLDEAHERFAAAGDPVGRLHAAISSTEMIFFEHVDFRLLERWIDVLESLLAQGAGDETLTFRAAVALFIALLPGHMGEARTAALADRLLCSLPECQDGNGLGMAACQLMTYFAWMGQPAKSARVLNLVERINPEQLHPQTRFWLSISNFNNALAAYDTPAMERETRLLQDMAGAMPITAAAAYFTEINRLLSLGCWREALQPLEAYRRSFDPAKSIHLQGYHFQRAWAGILAGGGALALDDARAALDLVDDTGSEFRRALAAALYAQALAGDGEFAAALAELDKVAQVPGTTPFGSHFRFILVFTRAAVSVTVGGGAEVDDVLRESLTLARQGGWFNYFGWLPESAARLCAEALIRDIEADTARELIRRRQLAPPKGAAVAHLWPWPIRVRTLGGFAIELEGTPVDPRGKGQQKPLQMMKALVALGGGQVPLTTLADEVWPDSDGDRAQHAAETALYRLRRLLGSAEAVTVGQGRVGLNPELCAVDILELEQLIEAWSRLPRERYAQTPIQPLIDAYGGDFLPDDRGSPLFEAVRSRLRERFLATVFIWADASLAAGRAEAAIGCLRQLADRLPGNEVVYLQWLRLLLAEGRRPEAALVHARYRAESARDGVHPSPALAALMADAGG